MQNYCCRQANNYDIVKADRRDFYEIQKHQITPLGNFILLLSFYVLNFGAPFWEILSLGMMAAAIVLAVCSWIVGYISDEK